MNRFDEGLASEYMKIRYRKVIPDRRLLAFAVGAIVGLLFFYLSGGVDIKLTSDFWSANIMAIGGMEVGQYVFAVRLKQLLFILVCSYSYIGNLMAYGVIGCLGFEFVLILFTFVYNFHLWGILLSVAMVLPHWIFYGVLIMMVFERWLDSSNPSIYGERAIIVWKMVMAVILFLLGFMCEICINYELVQKIILAKFVRQ